ncbi:MAG: tripartite tricarboxylate transporter substrate binding protein [Hyphomicrobiales bacterium]|nr:tripartite tricarboxylate transporter substrate binding protein [Hyphomicrobiales bacterium]
MRASLTAVLFVPALIAWDACAQPGPARPLRMVAGFSAGGNADTVARLYAAELGKRLGQPVVVDNRTGAAGTIATNLVAKSVPDGYTLLWTTGAHPATAALHTGLPFDAVKSFAFVSVTMEFPFVLAVRADGPYRKLDDLIAAGRSDSSKVTYATSGIGTTIHLTIEYLQARTGARFVHVPYKGGSVAVAALSGGEVHMAVSSPLDIATHVRAGRMRALAVTSKTRNSRLPDTPTVDEAGVRGFEVTTWNGVAAASGTPKTIVDRLAAEIQRASQQPELRQTVESLGSEAVSSSPSELQRRVETELRRWTEIVQQNQIKVQ